jgi:hypothetical protein
VILLNAALAGAFAAVAVPVLVHIIHQRRVTEHRWAAMRFLHEMMARSRSRLLLDQWLLLLLRCGAIACLTLALMRPALEPGGDDVVARHGKTAAVILFDDSLSSATGRDAPRIARMQELTLNYLDTLSKGDEISLIRLSQLQAAADPLFDLEAVRDRVRGIAPSDVGSDHVRLLSAGLTQLERHVNPTVELVLVTDGLSDGWNTDERVRWRELRDRLVRDPEATAGTRDRPRMVLLSPGDTGRLGNLSISAVSLDRSVVTAEQEVAITVNVDHHGDTTTGAAMLRLQVDGRTVAERELELELGESRELVFHHRFAGAGSHALEAVIEGARDDLAADDRRAVAVEVVRGLPVLLVEGRRGQGLAGSGAFVAAALDPDGEGAGLFALERIASTQLGTVRLGAYRAVVLCDVPALDARALAALERYVAEGGGVLVGCGPATDRSHVNRLWARDGEGFLPCPLGEVRELERPLVPRLEAKAHRAVSPFAGAGGEAWGDALVRRYRDLSVDQVPAGELVTLLGLENGDPFLVLRRRGLGQVALFAGSLDLAWTELPIRAAFVPLIRGVVGHLGGQVLPPRNLLPGQELAFVRRRSVVDPHAAAPDGTPVPLRPGSWEGRQVYVSPPVRDRGVYTVRDDERVLHFAVAADSDESLMTALGSATLDEAFADQHVLDLRTASAVQATFAGAGGGDLELWRYLLAACLGLLFIETLVTRHQSRGERGPA